MKFKFIFIIASLVLITVLVSFQFDSESDNKNPTVLGEPTSNDSELIKVGAYSASYFRVENTDSITLKSNLDSLDSSSKLKCDNLINAGFYTKSFKHSGLFISEGNVIQDFIRNKTYNAVISVNDLGTPRITRETPKDTLRFAVQTGPMLIENAQVQELSLVRDKSARRMIAAVTGNNEIIFIAIFDKSSSFEGPLLSELPELINQFGIITGEIIADAVNLDGGSASAFRSDSFSLTEISTIGGYFCVI